MALWKRKVVPQDHRTEELIERMDKFLEEMQTVADRLVAKLEVEGGEHARDRE